MRVCYRQSTADTSLTFHGEWILYLLVTKHAKSEG